MNKPHMILRRFEESQQERDERFKRGLKMLDPIAEKFWEIVDMPEDVKVVIVLQPSFATTLLRLIDPSKRIDELKTLYGFPVVIDKHLGSGWEVRCG